VEVVGARKLQAHDARVPAREIDRERLAVGVAVEGRAVVLIHAVKRRAVVRDQHHDARTARREVATAVVENHAAQRQHVAEVDLPPGLLLVQGVEAPLAVLDAVTGAGGVALLRHGPGGFEAQLVLAPPVGFELARGDGRRGFGAECDGADHETRQSRHEQGA